MRYGSLHPCKISDEIYRCIKEEKKKERLYSNKLNNVDQYTCVNAFIIHREISRATIFVLIEAMRRKDIIVAIFFFFLLDSI